MAHEAMTRSKRARCLGPLFAAIGGWACGSALPLPPNGPHVRDEPIEVPYPPPPAVPEIVPPNRAGKQAVWVDGEHLWTNGAWVWQPGRWEVPAPGSYFARPEGRRLADGRLIWYAGTWHAGADARMATPASTSPVRPPSPRSPTGVPLPTLPPGAEHVPEPPTPPAPSAPPTPAEPPPAPPTPQR